MNIKKKIALAAIPAVMALSATDVNSKVLLMSDNGWEVSFDGAANAFYNHTSTGNMDTLGYYNQYTDGGETAGTTYRVDSHVAIGATYVTDLGDSAVTIGAGWSEIDGSKTGTAVANDTGGFHVGLSAVTGDLTVAVGYADGSKVGTGVQSGKEMDGDVVKAGVKYVSGDLTFNVGITSGDAKDNTIGSVSGSDDSKDTTSASVSYAVASGVTAILGYTSVEASDEGASSTDGSAWYIGANMAF